MISLLIAARAVITLLRSLARARTEALEPLPDPRVRPLTLVQIRDLRAKAWSALAELGRLAAAASLELPLAVRRVVAMWGEEDAVHDGDAAEALRVRAREVAIPLAHRPCLCASFGCAFDLDCPSCAGIGYALPDAPAKPPMPRLGDFTRDDQIGVTFAEAPEPS